MKLLLVEDELEMARMVRSALERSGFVVDWANSIEMAEEFVLSGHYDLVILDRRLEDGEGTDLIPVLRQRLPSVPVLVLSALNSSSDKVEGLNLGADDYLAKPFLVDELLARVRALLRRQQTPITEILSLGNVTLDATLGQVAVDDVTVDLPRRELLLLESLMRRARRTVRRSLIESEVYGTDDDIAPNMLEPHVSRLRKRLTEAGATIELHTVRGVGYFVNLRP